MNPSLLANPNSTFPLLLSTVHLLAARGFGKRANSKGESADPSRKQLKAMRNKLIPCESCRGSGLKPCQFCQGTKLMVGFLGARVPCIPCKEKGTLGKPCKNCNGMGFLQL